MKKTILFVTLAVAIVVGCTTEMLDTSYENIVKEAQLKGENPVVFGAYAGNEYGQTRGNFTTSRTKLFNGAFSSSDEIGVFAYYTGSIRVEASSNYSSSKWPETLEASINDHRGWFSSRNHPQGRYLTPNFMYNQRLVYNSSSNWTYSPTKYWPQEGKVSFFAYYPYQSSSNWESSKRLNIIRKDYSGTPFLEYNLYMSSYNGGYHNEPLDLMAAAPVFNKTFDITKNWNSSDNTVQFKMKHLLAAMSVKLLVKSNGSWDNNLQIRINNAVLRGNGSNSYFDQSPSAITQFKKGGRYDLAHACWYTAEYEPLNLIYRMPYVLDNFESSKNWRLYKLYSDKDVDYEDYESSQNWFASSFNESFKKDGYMTIIPLPNRESNKYLAVLLDYSIASGDRALFNRGFADNKHIEKVIEIPGGIQPGKYYQILLELDLNAVNINATVESGQWEVGQKKTFNFVGSSSN